MILSENRYPLCANAALRVRIMLDQISRPSTFSVSDLTRSGTFSRCGFTAKGFAERVQRAFLVADLLHDHAEPGERAEMAGFTDQDLLDVFKRVV